MLRNWNLKWMNKRFRLNQNKLNKDVNKISHKKIKWKERRKLNKYSNQNKQTNKMYKRGRRLR